MKQMPIDAQQITLMWNDKWVLNDLSLHMSITGTVHSIQPLSVYVQQNSRSIDDSWSSKPKKIHHHQSSTGRLSNELRQWVLSYIHTKTTCTKRTHPQALRAWTSVYFCDSSHFYHPPTLQKMIKWEERVFAALNAWAMKVFPAVPATEMLTQPFPQKTSFWGWGK